MTAVWFRFRHELRAHWRASVVLALLVGAAGGIALAVLAVLAGVPLGVVFGRWAWTRLADDLGTVAEPIVPVVAVCLAIPVVLILVNAVAFAPGRLASRLRPATVLRAE